MCVGCENGDLSQMTVKIDEKRERCIQKGVCQRGDVTRVINNELKMMDGSEEGNDLDVIEDADQRRLNSYVETSMVKLRRIVCDNFSSWGRMRLRKSAPDLRTYKSAFIPLSHIFYTFTKEASAITSIPYPVLHLQIRNSGFFSCRRKTPEPLCPCLAQ